MWVRKRNLLFLIVLLPVLVKAGDYDDGLLAYSQGNFKSAQASFIKAAEQGESGAYHMLSRIYSESSTGLKSQSSSLSWLKKAADAGIAQAQFQLAGDLLSKKQFNQAYDWYLKASSQGHAPAYIRLAKMLNKGQVQGVSAAEKQVIYERASMELDVFAQKGHAEFQNALAYMYQYGLGMEANSFKAVAWYQKAAHQGDVEAQYNLAYLLATDKTTLEESAFWMRTAAKNGHQQAKAYLKKSGKGVALKK